MALREIKSHRINKCNEFIAIFSEDEPQPGGAYSHYRISVMAPDKKSGADHHLRFHTGQVFNSKGDLLHISGITDEALLAVVLDRLRMSNRQREDSLAITKLEEALHWIEAGARVIEVRL